MTIENYATMDEIEEVYSCIVCHEGWTTSHWIADYEDDQLCSDHICVMCHGSIKDAVSNKLEYEKQKVYEVAYYIVKRLFNKMLLAIRLP